MGTRGIIGLVNNDIEKITYNHFDSYPDALGMDVLKWARETDAKDGWDEVREKATALRLVDEQEHLTAEEAIEHALHTDTSVGGPSTSQTPDWYQALRHLQGNLQGYLDAGVMIDSGTFPLDSLFCEWGYLINLDDSTFEVYQGFQTSPPLAGRWATPERVAEEQKMYDEQQAAHPSDGGDVALPRHRSARGVAAARTAQRRRLHAHLRDLGMSEHTGSLMSGEVTCSCGWSSGHHALASDAVAAFNQHIDEEK